MMKQKFITLGEIMLRLMPPDYEKIRTATVFEARYGGSEANVALSWQISGWMLHSLRWFRTTVWEKVPSV